MTGAKPLLSVEFFPPKDDAGGAVILETAKAIREFVRPDFVSITYGAGGSTRERTFRYARILKDEYGFEVMPHLTCVGASYDQILATVREYEKAGFRNIMALRGDPPKGATDFRPHPDGPGYGSDLVKFLRKHFPDFTLGVAGYPEVHPEAPDAETDLRHLKFKVEQGASFITTQLFYDNAQYFRFIDDVLRIGIQVPVLPGIMPIRSADQARRFCKVIPDELDALLNEAGDDKSKLREVAANWAYRQIAELLRDGAKGVHLYIMNRSSMTVEVVRRLRNDGLL